MNLLQINNEAFGENWESLMLQIETHDIQTAKAFKSFAEAYQDYNLNVLKIRLN